MNAAPVEQLVSLVAPTSMEADQYRALRHTVERLHRTSQLKVLALTSPGPGEGKTVTTLNLAGALAQSRRARVLVIDADLHRPAVGEYLGLLPPHSPGLVDAIQSDACGIADVVRRLDSLNLSVVLSGVCQTGAYEALSAPRLGALVAEARERFDYVLIDTPPVVPLPDCRVLAQWVDGFLMLVAAHRTPRKALAEALTLIDPGKVIGLVFNGEDRQPDPYSSYYGQYGAPAAPSRIWRSR